MSSFITLTTTDHASLKARLENILAANPKNRATWQRLSDELQRAAVLPAEIVSADVVRVGSTFTVRDLDTDERDTFTLAWPEHADVDQGRLSVLAPLGTAVIGFSRGDEIVWDMPGGQRRLALESVATPVAAV